MTRHVGLIGGIGPAATVVYYRALVGFCAAAGRPLDLTIAHADVRGLLSNMEAGRGAEQAAVYAGHVDRLRAAGCDAVAVTSMGGHFCIRELEAMSSVPVLNAVPALDAYFGGAGVARVGVLGTKAVMRSGLYGLTSVEVIAPTPDELEAVHADYVAVAASGAVTPRQRDGFVAAGGRLVARGADLVVLGGADLSLAFDGVDPGYRVVDSALVHAEAIARYAMTSAWVADLRTSA